MGGKPKFDVVNEQQILATVARDPSQRKRIFGTVHDGEFRGEPHQAIFRALRRCEEQGLEPDAGAVATCAEGEDFGGMEYLQHVLSIEPAGDRIEYHLERFLMDAARFDAAQAADEARGILLDRSRDFAEAMRSAFAIVDRLKSGASGAKGRGTEVLTRYTEDINQRMAGNIPFRSTGYMLLDAYLTQGLFPGGVTVIGGRTGMGKSTTVKDMIRRLLADKAKPVRILMAPLEEGAEPVIDSLVSGITQIPVDILIKEAHTLEADDRERVREAATKLLTGGRLHIEDNFYGVGAGKMFGRGGRWSNERAIERMEEMIAEGEYDIAIWDLWERMLTDLDPQRINMCLARVQMMARRYKCHQVLVQQLKQDVERRDDPRPTRTDLKSCGAYLEVADLVLFLHRDRVYRPHLRTNEIEINVAKQKRGEDGFTMVADYRPDICRLTNERIQRPGERGGKKARFSKDEEEAI